MVPEVFGFTPILRELLRYEKPDMKAALWLSGSEFRLLFSVEHFIIPLGLRAAHCCDKRKSLMYCIQSLHTLSSPIPELQALWRSSARSLAFFQHLLLTEALS